MNARYSLVAKPHKTVLPTTPWYQKYKLFHIRHDRVGVRGSPWLSAQSKARAQDVCLWSANFLELKLHFSHEAVHLKVPDVPVIAEIGHFLRRVGVLLFAAPFI